MKTLVSGPLVTIALFAIQCAYAAPMRCSVPGQAEQWAVDYCMYAAATDDLANPEVGACMKAENRAVRNACSAKKKYKAKICAIVVRHGSYSGSAMQCRQDGSFAGPTVRNGEG